MWLNNVITFSLLVILFSCRQSPSAKEKELSPRTKNTNIKYAKRFSIVSESDIKTVYLFGNRYNFDTTSVFVISNNTSSLNKISLGTKIKSPCKKIAALSSIYASMFYELGCITNLVAIDNIDYINNKAILKKHENDSLIELAKGPIIDVEKAITTKPDIIFTFGMGEGEQDVDKRLFSAKLPVAVSIDHLEENPLARAEWIKFFAAFVDKEKQADSIFNEVEKNYLTLKSLAQKETIKPTVFTELKYSEFWYMPGGRSYVAQLLHDAAADFLWKDDSNFGSLPLSFEQVYAKAKEADYWINLSGVRSRKELLDYETRYKEFKAFKKGNLFNNVKTVNSKNYSTYWETGMIHPDRILSDLIIIFHSHIKADINSDFYYYVQLE